MTGNIAIDVAIGLVFIYLLYSLLATIIQELIASYFSFRSKILERAIYRMLEDGEKFNHRFEGIFHLFKKTKNDGDAQTPSEQFYKHPLIKFLAEGKFRNKPSYINSSTFSKVIVDLLRGNKATSADNISSLISKALKDEKLMWGNIPIAEETLNYLNSIWTDAQGDVDKFKATLEDWFDETMERASGWYKNYTQIVLFFIGLVLAIFFNVDTIKITNKLAKDPKLREQVVQQADAFVKAHPNLDQELNNEIEENKKIFFAFESKTKKTNDSLSKIKEIEKRDSITIANYKKAKLKRDELLNRADSLVKGDIRKVNNSMGLGYENFKSNYKKWTDYVYLPFGWLITALAISLGAPFWFDLLNKLMKLRSSVSTETTAENNSKKTSKEEKTKAVG